MRWDFSTNHYMNNLATPMSLCAQISSALLVSVGLISSAVLADEGQLYVAPGLQWMDFDDTTGLEEDVNYLLGVGYDFTDRASTVARLFTTKPTSHCNLQCEVFISAFLDN
jgi:hypothetical protein|tara:strand:- start:139 stop:471 length:333 start_codon:yes stop_codon:yes gene_type:complete